MNSPTVLKSLCAATAFAFASVTLAAPDYLDVPLKDIQGRRGTLNAWAGQVILIVNVASDCGYTRQYEGLEKLYRKYKDDGFVVLGFPCNDFGNQEPSSEKNILQFCKKQYDVTFPLFSKVSIRQNPHPVFKALTEDPSPIPGPVLWNFNKFLLDREGILKERFDSSDEPDSAKLVAAIEKALAAKPPKPQ